MIFIFFWSGIYGNEDYEHYAYSAYPFYLLLLLLIFERLAQMWIDNRYGCTKELMQTFDHIEVKDKMYKDLAR